MTLNCCCSADERSFAAVVEKQKLAQHNSTPEREAPARHRHPGEKEVFVEAEQMEQQF